MPFITTNTGINWHYDREGEGKPLLFLHGWGVDKRIWRQQSKYFSQYYSVLTIDLPGHGKTTWGKISLAQMSGDLNRIIETLALNQFSLVGSSLGGLLAIKFCGLFPDKIKCLTLVGVLPKFSQSEDYPYGLDIERMRKLGGQLNLDYPQIINVFFRSLFTREERSSRRFKWLQKFRRFADVPQQQALAEYLNILEKEDLRDVFKRIKVPLQFINGTEDYICGSGSVLFLKSVFPQARFDDFPHCGHFPFLSKPYEFNAVLEEFLKEI